MPTVWSDSVEVKQIAEMLINKDLKFQDIVQYEPKIAYLFKSAKKSKELGKCSKATGPFKHLSGIDYVIACWQEWFQDASPADRESLVYHELEHIEIIEDEETGEIKFKIKKHDVECFIDEVKKYKDWCSELSELKKAFEE